MGGDQRRVLARRGTVAEPAFYAYARPEPSNFAAATIRPAAAYYSAELADFMAAQAASRPGDTVLDFYQSVYARRLPMAPAGIAPHWTALRRNGGDQPSGHV